MSGWLAALGAVTAVLVMLLLLAAGARAALPTTLRSWLLCVAAAVTLFDVIALGFNLVAGGCDAVLSTAVLRPLATVVRPAMRYSPWAPPTLTHTHKPTPCTPCRCPPPPSSTPPSTPSPLHLLQVLYAMRGQACAFAVLVAHQACPVRSVRTHT